jgi:hypothetical protein
VEVLHRAVVVAVLHVLVENWGQCLNM